MNRRGFFALLTGAAVAPIAPAAALPSRPAVFIWGEPPGGLDAVKAFFLANPGPHYRFKDWDSHRSDVRGNVKNFEGVEFVEMKGYSA